MSNELVCWKCGASLTAMRLPLLRRAECPACQAELHVCRLCTLYNPHISDRCDEPRAEHPLDTERANFCDYFKPKPNAYLRRDPSKTFAAKAKLDTLFGNTVADGEAPEETDAARKKLDELFGPDDKNGR